MTDYLMSVKETEGEFEATCRPVTFGKHWGEPRSAGQAATGKGANELAAMVSAIANLRIGQ